MSDLFHVVVTGADAALRRAKRIERELNRKTLTDVLRQGTAIIHKITLEELGRGLRSRTGRTARSIRKRVNPGAGIGKVFSDRPSLAAFEDGSLITPRTSQRLAVPIPGTPAVGREPSNFVKRFVTTRGDKDPLLWGGEPAQPLFVLKRSVKMPALGIFRKSHAQSRPFVEQLFQKSVEDVITRA